MANGQDLHKADKYLLFASTHKRLFYLFIWNSVTACKYSSYNNYYLYCFISYSCHIQSYDNNTFIDKQKRWKEMKCATALLKKEHTPARINYRLQVNTLLCLLCTGLHRLNNHHWCNAHKTNPNIKYNTKPIDLEVSRPMLQKQND